MDHRAGLLYIRSMVLLFSGKEVSLSFYNIPDTSLHLLEDGMVTLFVYFFFFFNLRDIYLPSHNATHGYEWLNLLSPQGNIAVLHPMKNCDIWSQHEALLLMVPQVLFEMT